jgi:hypothetical protein
MLILCVLIFSTCTAGCNAKAKAEETFLQDIDVIAADIQVMYEEVDADFLYWPFLYIAFADVDFDEIPEFFYGYQCLTGMQAHIWYRGYSLNDSAIIQNVRLSDWHTYISGDEKCSFYTGSDEFLEGYYLNEEGEPCFIAKAVAGSATWHQTHCIHIEYSNATLYVSDNFECNQDLTPVKQVWSETTLETLREDMIRLLEEYRG